MRFYYDPNFYKFFESKVFLIVLAFIIPTNIRKPSDIIYLWYIIFPIIPLISLYWMKNEARVFVYFAFISVFLLRYFKDGKTLKIKKIQKNNYYGIYISLFFTIVGVIWFFISGAVRNFNLDLASVYDFRREVGISLSYGILGYISVWVYKVFSIYLLTYAFYKKNIIFIVVMILLQIFYFGVTSHKSVLFFPFLIFGLFYIFKNKSNTSRLINYLNALLLFFLFLVIYTNTEFILSLGFRRAFFTTSRMLFDYYAIFSDLGYIYMSNNLLSFFLDYPYSESPFFFVGSYFGGEDLSANVGYLGTSFMHFGFVGMILFTVIIGQILAIIDKITLVNQIPNWFASSLVIIPFNSLFTSAELSTTLLTHGLAMSLLLLWLSNFKEKNI